MDDASMVEKIVLFGLSRQEAIIYICLLKHGELTGYEVSKLTGISRSNVYSALAALVEHGAAYLMECSASKYVPVLLGEFCDNRLRYLNEVKGYLLANSPKQTEVIEGYITIQGYRHIMDKIHHMLLSAHHRIYLSASAGFVELWKSEISTLVRRKIKVVLIMDSKLVGFPSEGLIIYQSIGQLQHSKEEWEERSRQLRLIIDSAYVLTGEITGTDSDNCLYSAQKNFINVFKEAMSNEIKLINYEERRYG